MLLSVAEKTEDAVEEYEDLLGVWFPAYMQHRKLDSRVRGDKPDVRFWKAIDEYVTTPEAHADDVTTRLLLALLDTELGSHAKGLQQGLGPAISAIPLLQPTGGDIKWMLLRGAWSFTKTLAVVALPLFLFAAGAVYVAVGVAILAVLGWSHAFLLRAWNLWRNAEGIPGISKLELLRREIAAGVVQPTEARRILVEVERAGFPLPSVTYRLVMLLHQETRESLS